MGGCAGSRLVGQLIVQTTAPTASRSAPVRGTSPRDHETGPDRRQDERAPDDGEGKAPAPADGASSPAVVAGAGTVVVTALPATTGTAAAGKVAP